MRVGRPTERSRFVKRLASIAGMRAQTLGDAIAQVAYIAPHWPALRADEKRKIEAAAIGHAGLIEMRTSRATGTQYGIYDTIAQGIESTPERGMKITVICETHNACVCVPSVAIARQTVAAPDFCDDCRDILAKKGWFDR